MFPRKWMVVIKFLFPYHSKDGPCKYRPEHSAANVTAFENIPQQEEALMMAVANMGPISAAIDASLDTFRFYKEGKHLFIWKFR